MDIDTESACLEIPGFAAAPGQRRPRVNHEQHATLIPPRRVAR
jgi:hypothetical protein